MVILGRALDVIPLLCVPVGVAIVLVLLLKELFWKERRSLRTLLILQLMIGAAVAFMLRYTEVVDGRPAWRELCAMAVLWIVLMWSVHKDRDLARGSGNGGGWRRFRRKHIPKGTLKER